MRAQYQELVHSAQTVDLLVRQYSNTDRAQEDLKNDNIFEIYMAKIRFHDYKMKSGNVTGAQFVTGRGHRLLLAKVAEKAANCTNSAKKLENNLGARRGPFDRNWPDRKGAGKGMGGPPGPLWLRGIRSATIARRLGILPRTVRRSWRMWRRRRRRR